MRKLYKYRLALFVTLTLALAACDKSNNDVDNNLETNTTTTTDGTSVATTDAQQNSVNEVSNPDWPTYIVATDPSNAPYERKNIEGVIEGVDNDLINAIASTEHFNVTIIPQPWDGIFESLYFIDNF